MICSIVRKPPLSSRYFRGSSCRRPPTPGRLALRRVRRIEVDFRLRLRLLRRGLCHRRGLGILSLRFRHRQQRFLEAASSGVGFRLT